MFRSVFGRFVFGGQHQGLVGFLPADRAEVLSGLFWQGEPSTYGWRIAAKTKDLPSLIRQAEARFFQADKPKGLPRSFQ